jgi:hypothetical protein
MAELEEFAELAHMEDLDDGVIVEEQQDQVGDPFDNELPDLELAAISEGVVSK